MNITKRIYILGILAEDEKESLTGNKEFLKEKEILLWRYSMKNIVEKLSPEIIVSYMDAYQFLKEAESMLEIVEGVIALHDILEE